VAALTCPAATGNLSGGKSTRSIACAFFASHTLDFGLHGALGLQSGKLYALLTIDSVSWRVMNRMHR
jgi:hypothetical protein